MEQLIAFIIFMAFVLVVAVIAWWRRWPYNAGTPGKGPRMRKR